ncbi:MHS family alpha-ketoglutarate permease-like MFS transporter [Sphingomonas sp. BE270]|jgi:MHS family alpha-ketoglutarate permease-like MFS transporter|uniref:MFS transporter n=1 Tax=unclassified Sphingomonas TaxID=196159 RepID=UPI00053F0C92|nr:MULTISPECIES: MFS transporter [unclassified Sphingomonas]MDR6849997.1 MHS family alpha-ketoglutarate permease-like MFS transporter [Sphingomonas sp. BE137]MDR7259751.1 MHS family alpha-ketoglutarate permease-like MFS transporter [Sphingomonas sp. BE270]
MALEAKRLRAIIGGSAGNLVEWYDWYAYSALSLYFSASFFPKGDPTAQLLNTSAVFAVGFFMRPIGAYLMGRYADRHGRKAGLAVSVALMCAGSLMIAFAPTYATIGIAAPILLLVARLLQGLSVGGEYGASATYLSEMATRRHRGFWSSFQYVTLIGGMLSALAVTLLLQAVFTKAQMDSFGWRIAFALGAALALGVYLLRRGLAETASFRALAVDRPASGMAALWRAHPREFLLVGAISAGGGLAFYAYTTYMQKFLANTVGFSVQTATAIMTAALVVFMLVQPLFGALADRVGRKPMLLLFGIGGAIVSVPVFSALENVHTPGAAFAIVLVPLLLLAAYTSISALVKAELFPAHIRALGVAFPYAIGNAAFGGTAEYVALSLKGWHIESAFYWYVSGMLALTSVCFWLLPETRQTSLIVED